MRISNSTISRNYTRDLQRSFARVANLNYKSTTWQKFSTMAEDSIGGVRAFELRRSLARLETNRDNARSALSVISSAEGQLSIAHNITKEFHEKIVQSLTDTSGPDEREAIAKELTRKREEMLTIMNGRFSDRYLFGGLDIENPPFEYGAETINPSAAGFAAQLDQMKAYAGKLNPPDAALDAELTAMEASFASYDIESATAAADMTTIAGAAQTGVGNIETLVAGWPQAQQDAIKPYLDSFKASAGGLEHVQVTSTLRYQGYDVATTLNPNSKYFDKDVSALVQRDYYIDVGLGISFDDGNVDPDTAYMQSFNGLEIFGTGDKNILLQMDAIIAEITSPNFDNDKLGKMLGEPNTDTGFLAAADALNLQVVKIGADTSYLEFVIDRYNEEEINLTDRRTQVEMVDPAKAIMDYELEYTAYQAALQMGQRLIMPTLWDFVK
jgi:flagellar hook-associated protein 3